MYTPAHPLLGNALQVSFRFLLLDRAGGLGFTIGTALGHGAFPSATPHAHTVDHESLTVHTYEFMK